MLPVTRALTVKAVLSEAMATRCTPVPATPLPIVVATPFICATFTDWFAGRATESGVTSNLLVS